MSIGENSTTLFIVCASLFVIHQYLQKIASVNIPLLDNYLDPLMLMPILLHLIRLERIYLFKGKDDLSLTHVFGYFLLVAFIGEVIFPALSDEFTADILDVLFYGLGGVIYICVSKVPRD